MPVIFAKPNEVSQGKFSLFVSLGKSKYFFKHNILIVGFKVSPFVISIKVIKILTYIYFPLN